MPPSDQRCGWCNRPTYGHYVTINGTRYCHDLASPTCYEKHHAQTTEQQTDATRHHNP